MRLTLVRHGIAIDRQAPDCPPEAERYLTRAGVERTRRAMQGLRRLAVRPDAILSSPYVRARQTAEIAAQALGLEPREVGLTRALLPAAAPAELYAELAGRPEEHLLCCGHAPHVDALLAFAVGRESAFTALRKAGAAALEIDPREPGEGDLLWLATARMLRRLASRDPS